MKKTLCFIFAAILTLSISARGEVKEPRRGKFLRNEITKTDTRHEFTIELEKSKDGQLGMPVLEFKKITILTLHEVPIYEKLIEIVHENAGQGITERGNVEYRLVPDEFFKGEETLREVIEEVKPPLAETELKASLGNSNWTITTDKDGKYIDSSQRLLEVFDNLRIKSSELVMTHNELGSKSLTLTRNLLKRETANMPDSDNQSSSDILEAFGQDYTQLRLSNADGLRTSVIAPAKAGPGEAIAITVKIENKGDKSICNLMGRSFSSDSSLNGKMFYFGSIAPGKKSSFTRIVKLPESKGRVCYVSVGFWTILGTAQKNECRFSIEIDDNAQ